MGQAVSFRLTHARQAKARDRPPPIPTQRLARRAQSEFGSSSSAHYFATSFSHRNQRTTRNPMSSSMLAPPFLAVVRPDSPRYCRFLSIWRADPPMPAGQ